MTTEQEAFEAPHGSLEERVRAAVDWAPVDALVTRGHVEELTAHLVRWLTPTLHEAWEASGEAHVEWVANNPGWSGVPHDPPRNPFEREDPT